ncbi:MAG: zinc finger domain-containing protein [Terracidiphilus sp.]
MERWFGKITTQRIRRRTFKSVAELIAAINDYIQHNNADPQPFIWTKSAAEIIRKVNRGRAALKMPALKQKVYRNALQETLHYDASPIQQDWIRRAGWCLVACPECGAVPGVACTVEHRGRGKKFNIPVHDSRRELATEKGFGSVGLAHLPTHVSNLPGRAKGTARGPKGPHAPSGYFDHPEVWAVLYGKPENGEQNGGPGDLDPAITEVENTPDRVGGGITPAVLPHHRTCRSASGGS